MKDYYQILGVDRTATDEEIRQAFRKLAMKHHPDRGGDSSRFQEINEAHAVLGDKQKRRDYDTPQSGFQQFGFGQRSPFQDMFDQFRRQTRQTHVRLTLWISLRDCAVGGERTVTIGNAAGVTGAKIDIPLAVSDGDHVQYPRLGPGGCDLVVTFRINPEPGWERDGLNLKTQTKVSIWTLILGGEIIIRDILDKEYRLHVAPRTQPGTILRLAQRGMRNNKNQRGDILVEIQAVLPSEIPPEITQVIQKYTQ